jgi:GLPGLI family protein
MKKLLVLYVLLIALPGFSQSLKATYTAGVIIKPNIEVPSWFIPRIYSYEFCNGKSITTMISGPVPGTNVQSPIEDIYYKDFSTGSYNWEITMGGDSYSVRDKLPDFKWKILPETEVLNSYKCNKATGMAGTMPITAWFCREFNVQDGPNRYCGLPGLILKININDNTEIVATGIETSNKVISIKEPVAKSPVLSFKDMEQLVKEGIK